MPDTKTEKEIIDDLSQVMAESIIKLLRPCIEQRIKQFLPLIKEGLETNDHDFKATQLMKEECGG